MRRAPAATARDDVERLRRRAEERRDPDKVAAHALQWGMPVLESSITLIADDTLYYRGHDAIALAHEASVEAVASLVWTGRLDDRRPETRPGAARACRHRNRPVHPARAGTARARVGRGPPGVRPPTGCRAPNGLAHPGSPRRSGARTRGRGPIDVALARAWRVRAGGEEAIRAALILCADHELNVSAFTARCVASAGSNPYAVVTAGLAALEGTKHGGSTARVEATLGAMRRERSLRSALADRLRQGQRIDGFGHPLYRNGDPRAAALLEMLDRRFPKAPELRYARDFARAAAAVTGERPNVDFALGTVSRVLALPAGSGLTLFAIGRTIGWIGHAIEQYAVDQIIRPRAKYVGVVATARDSTHRETARDP